MARCGRFFSSFENVLLVSTIVSVITGVAIGFALRPLQLAEETQRLINFPGEIFMRVLKMMILPLIFSSLISGLRGRQDFAWNFYYLLRIRALAQMDARESGKMGLATVLYYSATTILSTITGIVLVLTIHPGDPTIKENWEGTAQDSDISPLDTLLDAVRNMFPRNIIQAMIQRVQTEYRMEQVRVIAHAKTMRKMALNSTLLMNASATVPMLRKKVVPAEGTNILGVIVFCTGFGIIISQLGKNARIIVEFFIILDVIIMKLINALMWLSPLGITSLIAGNVLELEDFSDTAQVLFLYIVTVLCGLTIHTLFTMPMLYFIVTRRNPMRIVRGMLQAIVTGFGTASGGAALPISMRCMEDKLGVDRRITRFVLPLGATINMDGNALYEAVAVIFIAQLNNVELSIAEVITVSVTATLASLGLNSAPAGLISILLILGTLGLPAQDVSLIITIDWLLDRVKAAVNVLGDAYCADAVSFYLDPNKHPRSTIDEGDDEKSAFLRDIHDEIEKCFNSNGENVTPLCRSSSDYLEHPERHRPALVAGEAVQNNVTAFDVSSVYCNSRRQSEQMGDHMSWNWRRRLSENPTSRKSSVVVGRVMNV